MKLANALLMGFALSFLAVNTKSCGAYAYNPYGENKCIGFSTENKQLETHNVTIYYGVPEFHIYNFLQSYDSYSIDYDLECEVKLTIRRRVYEDTQKKIKECPCMEKEIYSEILKFGDFLSYDYAYGKKSLVDTITKDDLYDNEDGYGYIIYDLYFTETDGVDDNGFEHIFSESELKTKELYYTIDNDKITFKITKQEY